ncbi:TIGR02678 family protein [Solirubrobacter phytolaccae]|uniref:TIGR02678 family protein n=1 Tax=Solirubrobacter phytolaccae TaxID=1404360 RepID=A0A9X3SHP0_9ACTN|nr:TIGR02678 family protein [Solirubrobacter phytolaccae]MDA0183302.1 TIGR02678 family protein [Solirubrobacter phytolaccae]
MRANPRSDSPDSLEARQKALRLLLRDGWLERRDEPELMEVLWREREHVIAEVFEVLGYRLEVERDMARLRKRPRIADPRGRGPRVRPEAKGGPTRDWWASFGYRHYLVLFCLLAELERDAARPQALISTLAEEVRRAVTQQGETLDYTQSSHRRVLCDVLRWLEDHGVLAVVDGDREAFATGDPRAVEALYNIDRVRLDRLAPSFLIADADREEMQRRALAEPFPPSEDGRRTRLRLSTARRLAEDPAVYFKDLSLDEQLHFRHQRRAIADRVCALTGLVAEHRQEGTALIDPTAAEATDVRFPTFQRDRQAALLIGAGLAAEHGRTGFTTEDVRRAARDLLTAHPKYFAKPEETMARDAVEQLAALDLLATDGATLRLLPAFGRFREAVGTTEEPADPQESLL